MATPLKKKLKEFMKILSENPFSIPYEKLGGDLKGAYSRRLNIQHRLVYQVDTEKQTVKIVRMWTHYSDN
jgi:Txe/YoeB family toxin of toxin-antitoxin system